MRAAIILAAGLLLTACSSSSTTAQPTTSPKSAASSSAAASASASPSPRSSPSGWTLISDAGGPVARADHTLTADQAGSKAYLFAGQTNDGIPLGDLWELDLASGRWRELDARGGPAPRFGHNAVWVDGTGLVVFAGQGQAFHNDLWAYDPDARKWRQLPASGDVPLARYGSCAAIGPDGRLWMSHGFTSDGTRFADTKAYNFDTGAWTDETPAGDRPVERCLHACWWTADDRLALFAGQTTGTPALGDLWHLSQGRRPGTNAWSESDVPTALRPRQLYASIRWRQATIVFGGGALNGGYLGDMWRITDGGQLRRLPARGGPSGRAGAELVADPRRDRLLLFGGRSADGPSAELWALSLAAP